MNNSIRHQLWVAFKIWFLAVLMNCILGTVWFAFVGSGTEELGWLLIFGALFGAIFSFPVFVGIALVTYVLVRIKFSGRKICLATYLTGILLTIFSFFLFTQRMYVDDIQLLVLAELAGIFAVTFQYRSLKKLGSEFSPAYKFDYEN